MLGSFSLDMICRYACTYPGMISLIDIAYHYIRIIKSDKEWVSECLEQEWNITLF
jgi:hypothetical protein